MKGKNIGFVSTRFAGIDGVSLEASKWSEVLEQNGHNCFWFAGELDDFRFYDEALGAEEIGAMIPEPATMILLGLGGLLIRKRR